MKKVRRHQDVTLEKIVGGGQAIGQLADGRKCFVWGGLPGEVVNIRETKRKSKYVEGIVEEIIKSSQDRVEPIEPDSYLSTSPWQIIKFETEQAYKAQLIDQAFELHKVKLPHKTTVFSDNQQLAYRNKLELSWYGMADENGNETLDLAFFRRGGRGKIIVEGSALARPEINQLAIAIRDLLRTKPVTARNLKTLLIRCNQSGEAVWQLYLKDKIDSLISPSEAAQLPAIGGQIIFSDPRSPASVITERLASFGQTTLHDQLLGKDFSYACEGFFQVNLPVYEQALEDMGEWVRNEKTDPTNPSETASLCSNSPRAARKLQSQILGFVQMFRKELAESAAHPEPAKQPLFLAALLTNIVTLRPARRNLI